MQETFKVLSLLPDTFIVIMLLYYGMLYDSILLLLWATLFFSISLQYDICDLCTIAYQICPLFLTKQMTRFTFSKYTVLFIWTA